MAFRIRALLVASIGAAGLVVTSSALAGFTSPRLFAGQEEVRNRVNLLYTQSTADDPVAKIVHHVPTPYRTNLSARPIGTLVGTAVLRGNPVDRIGDNAPNANLVLSGTVSAVRVDTSFTANGRTMRMGEAATACIGKPLGESAQYWLIRLRDAGGDLTWELPAFVDRRSPTTVFDSDATISVCFGAPDVPASNASRNPGGFRVREFELRLTRVFTTPNRGIQHWSTLVTPYQPRTGRVDTNRTVEVQSSVAFPRRATIERPVRVKLTAGFATFRFKGSVATVPHDRPLMNLYRGFNKSQVGSRTAKAYRLGIGPGRFTKLHTIKRAPKEQTFLFQVRGIVQPKIYGTAGCQANFHPEITCIQSTRAGYLFRSRNVTVKVPALALAG